MKHPKTLWKLGIIPPLSVFGANEEASVVINTANGAVKHQLSQKPIYKVGEASIQVNVIYRMPNATEIVQTVKATRDCPNPTNTAKKLTELMTQAIKETLGEDHEDFFKVNSTITDPMQTTRKRRTTMTPKPLTLWATPTTSTTTTTTTSLKTSVTTSPASHPPKEATMTTTTTTTTTQTKAQYSLDEIIGETDSSIYKYGGTLTYDKAITKCNSLHGVIPFPKSKEENDFVASLISNQFWIGDNSREEGIIKRYENFNQYWKERVTKNGLGNNMASVMLGDTNRNQWMARDKTDQLVTICEIPQTEPTATPNYGTSTTTQKQLETTRTTKTIPSTENEIHNESMELSSEFGLGTLELVGMTAGEIKLAKFVAEDLFTAWRRSDFPNESFKEYSAGSSDANPFLRITVQQKPLKPLLKYLHDDSGRTNISIAISYRNEAKLVNLDSKLTVLTPTPEAIERNSHLLSIRIVHYQLVSEFDFVHKKLDHLKQETNTTLRQLNKKRPITMITICRKDTKVRLPKRIFIKCTSQSIPVQIDSNEVCELQTRLCEVEPCYSIIGMTQATWIPIKTEPESRVRRQAILSALVGSSVFAGIESVKSYLHRNDIDQTDTKFRSLDSHISDLKKGISKTFQDQQQEIIHIEEDQVKVEQLDQNIVCSIQELELQTVKNYLLEKLNTIINEIETEGIKAASKRDHIIGKYTTQLCQSYNPNVGTDICKENISTIELSNIGHNGQILIGTFTVTIPTLEKETSDCTVFEQHFLPVLTKSNGKVIGHRINLSPRLKIECDGYAYYFNKEKVTLMKNHILLSLESEEFSSECQVTGAIQNCPVESILMQTSCTRTLYKDISNNIFVGFSSTTNILEAKFNGGRIAGLHSKQDGMDTNETVKLYSMSRSNPIKISCGESPKRSYTLHKNQNKKQIIIEHMSSDVGDLKSLESLLSDRITTVAKTEKERYWNGRREFMQVRADIRKLNSTQDSVLPVSTPIGTYHLTNRIIWITIGILLAGALLWTAIYCSFIKAKEWWQRRQLQQQRSQPMMMRTQSRLSRVYSPGQRQSAHL